MVLVIYVPIIETIETLSSLEILGNVAFNNIFNHAQVSSDMVKFVEML
jgi:hypothetical protein